MGRYINLPTLAIDFLKVASFSFDVRGNAIEGGRNSFGETQSIELAGGGFVAGSYDCIVAKPEQHEYWNWLGARLNGSHRFINVPIRTDFAGPFPTRGPIISGIPHSDGSLFSDGSGYSQATVYGEITAAAAVNAGILKMRVYGLARPLRWSDWFSIYHPTKGWRSYRFWDVLDKSSGANPVYTLAISPNLREAVSVNDRVEYARPRFVGKLPAGATLPWEANLIQKATPKLSFVEAF